MTRRKLNTEIEFEESRKHDQETSENKGVLQKLRALCVGVNSWIEQANETICLKLICYFSSALMRVFLSSRSLKLGTVLTLPSETKIEHGRRLATAPLRFHKHLFTTCWKRSNVYKPLVLFLSMYAICLAICKLLRTRHRYLSKYLTWSL